MSDAYADFFNVITNCKKEFELEVLSCMIVSANPWKGMPDQTEAKRKNATDLELLAKMKRKTEDLLLENNSEKVEELDNLIGNWIAELKNKT